MAHETVLEKPFKAIFGNSLFQRIAAEGADILAGLPLFQILDNRFLVDIGMRRIGDDQPLDPRRPRQRRRPTDRPASIMRGQRETVDSQRIGQCKDIGNQFWHGIIGDLGRLGGAGIAALVGRDAPETIRQRRHLMPPGAVAFWKAVQEKDRRVGRVTYRPDIKRNAGGKGYVLLIQSCLWCLRCVDDLSMRLCIHG